MKKKTADVALIFIEKVFVLGQEKKKTRKIMTQHKQ